MKIRKVNHMTGNETIVDEKFIKDFQEKGIFSVSNVLELIKNGERVYSNFSYFELVKEEIGEKNKECFGKCPKCSSENITWDDLKYLDDIDIIIQKGNCRGCGFVFKEVFKYDYTIYYDKK